MGKKIWTAAELEKMSPAERRKISRAAEITDPSEMPAELLERGRQRIRERIAATKGTVAR